jgi:hypothetical protein
MFGGPTSGRCQRAWSLNLQYVDGYPGSAEAEKRQDGNNHDDKSDEIDNVVHVQFLTRNGKGPDAG